MFRVLAHIADAKSLAMTSWPLSFHNTRAGHFLFRGSFAMKSNFVVLFSHQPRSRTCYARQWHQSESVAANHTIWSCTCIFLAIRIRTAISQCNAITKIYNIFYTNSLEFQRCLKKIRLKILCKMFWLVDSKKIHSVLHQEIVFCMHIILSDYLRVFSYQRFLPNKNFIGPYICKAHTHRIHSR